jgi:hypothetical protein
MTGQRVRVGKNRRGQADVIGKLGPFPPQQALSLNRTYFLRQPQQPSLTLQWPKDSAAMVYIRQDKLPKLKEYKYSGVDHSLLSQYVMKPFYTHVVIKCFPMWMA